MSHDYTKTRLTVDSEFRRLGLLAGGRRAFLRRGTTDREVVACVVGPRPNERNGIYAPEDRKALLSALDIDGAELTEPNKNDDIFVVRSADGTEVKHKIVAVPGRSEPGGLVVMWKLQVRRMS